MGKLRSDSTWAGLTEWPDHELVCRCGNGWLCPAVGHAGDRRCQNTGSPSPRPSSPRERVGVADALGGPSRRLQPPLWGDKRRNATIPTSDWGGSQGEQRTANIRRIFAYSRLFPRKIFLSHGGEARPSVAMTRRRWEALARQAPWRAGNQGGQACFTEGRKGREEHGIATRTGTVLKLAGETHCATPERRGSPACEKRP